MSTTPISLEQYFNAVPTVTDTVINAESPQPTSVLDPLRTPATLPSSDEEDDKKSDVSATINRVQAAIDMMLKDDGAKSINERIVGAIKAQGYKEIMPGLFAMEVKAPAAEAPKIPADVLKNWKDSTAEVAALYTRAEKVFDNMTSISRKYPRIFEEADRPLRVITYFDGNYRLAKNF